MSKLTMRDCEILENCILNSFLSFDQIHKRFFVGKQVCTVSNRLKKLESHGYLVSQNVGVFIYNNGKKCVKKIYEATNSARKILDFPIAKNNFSKQPKSYVGFYHDIILNDVLFSISQNSKWNGDLITCLVKEHVKSDIVPDALIFSKTIEKPIAIELELTAKSEKRYQDLIYKYKFSQEFSSVLYICGNDKIIKKINKVIKNLRLDSGEKFFFMENLNKYFSD